MLTGEHQCATWKELKNELKEIEKKREKEREKRAKEKEREVVGVMVANQRNP